MKSSYSRCWTWWGLLPRSEHQTGPHSVSLRPNRSPRLVAQWSSCLSWEHIPYVRTGAKQLLSFLPLLLLMLCGCLHRIHQQTAVGVRDTQVCFQVSAVLNQDQKLRNLNNLTCVKCSRYRPGVAHKLGRGIALLFHDRGTRRGEWSAARPGRTLPPGKNRYPFYRRLGGPQSRSGRAEDLVPTGIRSRTVQPVVSRHTDWATRPLL